MENIPNLNPRCAADSIGPNNVTINSTSSLKRGINTLNITFDNSSFSGLNYDDYKVNISLSDNSQFNLSMEYNNDNFTALFTPSISNASGTAKITILAVDENEIIKNDPSVDYTIEILNNKPKIGITSTRKEALRGESIPFSFTPSDIEDNVYDMIWKISLHNDTNNNEYKTLIKKGTRSFDYTLNVPKSYLASTMYINATVWDTEDDSSSQIYIFEVKNNKPEFTNIDFLLDGQQVSSSDLKNEGVFRGIGKLTVNLNCSDYENNESLKVTFISNDPILGVNVLTKASDYVDTESVEGRPGYFSQNITFPTSMSIGLTNLSVILKDNNQDIKRINYNIKIKNNAPKLDDFAINDTKSEQISFNKGEWIEFSFNATDEENDIKYFQVNIFYEQGQSIKTLNYSVLYQDENTTIRIRANDLPGGDYYVYPSVIDGEGAKGDFGVVSFSINEESRSDITVWLLFVVGIVIGFLVGAGLLYWRTKSLSFGKVGKDEESVNKGNDSSANKTGSDEKNGSKKKSKKKTNKKVIRRL